MASRKKTPAKAARKAVHSDASTSHGQIIITFTIGPIKRIKKGKSRKGGEVTPKEVKALLKWVLTQI